MGFFKAPTIPCLLDGENWLSLKCTRKPYKMFQQIPSNVPKNPPRMHRNRPLTKTQSQMCLPPPKKNNTKKTLKCTNPTVLPYK
mmetsp:Transcript_25821/g.43128  ORF Transcript_25821/g.43128 Transcript_25821/m.43128 type:complete len:84 (+) Transcript_25821:237-488(+)